MFHSRSLVPEHDLNSTKLQRQHCRHFQQRLPFKLQQLITDSPNQVKFLIILCNEFGNQDLAIWVSMANGKLVTYAVSFMHFLNAFLRLALRRFLIPIELYTVYYVPQTPRPCKSGDLAARVRVNGPDLIRV